MTRLTHGAAARRVRGGPTPEYAAWCEMRQRCKHAAKRKYRHWAGRGIKVCVRWNSFEAFLADMGPRPTAKHQVDRIKVNGDYEPANCRWATKQEQMRNTRVNRLLTFRGKTLSVAAWAEELGLNASTIRVRLHRGKSIEEALRRPQP